ncbi:3-keto-5-aminohexanoate cleavage protein [Seohaeicola saemankumensis]|nr:3-keto-5-aminohexanoate cleavage protein [Seohaeicola saemankumensis]MCA0869964.1 3-keto-5-aminohexanoate cleavage protein [Seohaeicola saemankumensis]
MSSVFLTCALVGNFTTRAHNPNLPITPKEIAEDALGAWRAGAAIVHIHVRDPETELPSMEIGSYAEVVERIRDVSDELIINLTTGNGGRFQPSDHDPLVPGPKTNFLVPEKRVEHILALRPDIATLDLNTMVFGGEVVINTPRNIRIMAEGIREAGARAEVELFDSGDIALMHDLMAEGTIEAQPLCSIVMGVKYGFVPSLETLLYARSRLPAGAQWTGFGTGRWAFPMVAMSAMAGGQVRIGMEDAAWLNRGEPAPSNGAMVEKAKRMLDDLGIGLATSKEARVTLGLVR